MGTVDIYLQRIYSKDDNSRILVGCQGVSQRSDPRYDQSTAPDDVPLVHRYGSRYHKLSANRVVCQNWTVFWNFVFTVAYSLLCISISLSTTFINVAISY